MTSGPISRKAKSLAHMNSVTHSPLPHWFEHAFSHASAEERQIAATLWREEPALRQLIQRLEAYLPSRWKPTACPRCDNRNIRKQADTSTTTRYFCPACDRLFSASEGTPFYRLTEKSYERLYGVAVALWSPWTPYFVWRILGCTCTKQFGYLRQRLLPLLETLDVAPLVSRPAYRLGFTPAQQGIRCPRCGGSDLKYRRRADPDNPGQLCMTCQYGFFLIASRRAGLPIPEEVHCPECAGRNLMKKTQSRDGRGQYYCRDCRRLFIEAPKKYQPPASKHIPAEREVPAEMSCPSCHGTKIRLTVLSKNGQRTFRCSDCFRQFLENPKRPPRHVKYTGLPSADPASTREI